MYYFGKGCIADYFGNSIAYLDVIDLKIVRSCENGALFKDLNTANKSDDCLNRVQKLLKKGVLVKRSQPRKFQPPFYGEFGKYYPKVITIELTNICNFFCPFCYKNALKNGNYISEQSVKEILSITNGKVRNFIFSGGEPTIHPNFTKYIDLFSEKANVSIITNGSTLYSMPNEIIRKIKQIQVSLYGCNNNEYESIVGCSDGYDRMINSVKKAKMNGVKVVGALTLCDEIKDKMEDYIKLSIDLGIGELNVGLAEPFGRGKMYIEKSNSSSTCNSLFNVLYELKHKYQRDVSIFFSQNGHFYDSNMDDMILKAYKGTFACGCGSESMVISQDGYIRPCAYLPEQFFSIKKANALEEHISGNFHITELKEGIRDYLKLDERAKYSCYAINERIW